LTEKYTKVNDIQNIKLKIKKLNKWHQKLTKQIIIMLHWVVSSYSTMRNHTSEI